MKKMKEALYSVVRRTLKKVRYRGLYIPIENPPISRKIFQQLWRSDYEVPELTAILALLRDGDRVLELGSGLGVVSALTSLARKDLTIRSYEGNPELLPFIARMHALNGITRVEVRNEILLPNPTTDTVEFLTHRSFAESSIREHDAVTRRIAVSCRDVNEAMAEFRPDVLICDIEGGEEFLFQGIRLNDLRVLVIELHPKLMPRQAVKAVYDTCFAAGLYPHVEVSTATVVAFERVSPP